MPKKITGVTTTNNLAEWDYLRNKLRNARSAKTREAYERRLTTIEAEMDRKYAESYTLVPETWDPNEWAEFWPKDAG